ncbi:MAG: hypothetical protein EHM61_18220 [Acidobacteria bacterium]|nr:MAG: hypothetical protein EHM61_18220 [Acidobacteriota bacterium]
MPRSTRVFVLVVLVLLLAHCSRFERPSNDQIKEAIQKQIALKKAPDYVTEGVKHSPRVWKMLQRFYKNHEYKPVWTGENRLSIEDLVAALCRADEHGLDPGNYHLRAIRRLNQAAEEGDGEKRAEATAQVELAATYAFLTYGSHLRNGYARPKWDVNRDPAQVDDVLMAAANGKPVKEVLTELLPRHAQYQQLVKVLQQYREIVNRGGWGSLNAESKPEELVARLIEENDIKPAGRGQSVSSEEILAGLVHFQRRHGLKDTGKLDPTTLSALNAPASARVRQIEINLERWRWLPQDLGSRYILVNVPAFELRGFEDGHMVLRMPVVVGQEYKPTPLFSDRMTYIVLNPSWNVPETIAKEEVLPRLLTDPDYLTRNEMEVVDRIAKEVVDPSSIEWTSVDPESFEYRFRQKPGDGNSLGRIKFMFPNQFDVYLHDTPAEKLFEQTRRDFSHGCVRVSRPVDLAEWVLKGSTEWPREKLEAEITGKIEEPDGDAANEAASEEQNPEKTVKLPSPLPVYILYWTVWVEEDGSVAFRDDVYDEDKKLLRALPAQVARAGESKQACDLAE